MREKEIEKLKDYKYGFTTEIENIQSPKGLTKETIEFISRIKNEPMWMLEWRTYSRQENWWRNFSRIVRFPRRGGARAPSRRS